jgi:hypothetical protein
MGCERENGRRDGDAGTDHDEIARRTVLGAAAAMGVSTLGGLATASEGSEALLTIRPTGEGVATFEVTADERIESVHDRHAYTTSVSKSAEDALSEEARQYRVVGRVTDLSVKGPAAAYLNGERLD